MAKLPSEMIKDILDKQSNQQSVMNLSLDDVESFGDKKSIQTMFNKIISYNKMLKERITFVNSSLTKAIPFTKENLYLLCAYSGSGKSTVAANVSYPLWKQGKKSLVISNEESEEDILFRIACLELGYNFNDYKKGRMPASMQKECALLFPKISQFVKVVDVNYKDGLTTKVEGVKRILELVANRDYSCAMIDYFQLIKHSANNPSASTYEVLNDFRIWLGQYIKRSNMPIVCFAQLHSLGKRNNKDLDSRIKHCPDIYEPSTVVIEIVPDFENKTSDFIIIKDRFGLAGHRVTCAFLKGRFVPLDGEAIRRLAEESSQAIEDSVDGGD